MRRGPDQIWSARQRLCGTKNADGQDYVRVAPRSSPSASRSREIARLRRPNTAILILWQLWLARVDPRKPGGGCSPRCHRIIAVSTSLVARFQSRWWGSSRAVDKEKPMLWKIWFSLTDRILVNVEPLGMIWVFYRSLPDEK